MGKGFPKKKIDEESYPRIKKIIESGAFKSKEIMSMFGISSATYYLIKNTGDINEYRDRINEVSRACHAKNKAKKAEQEETTGQVTLQDAAAKTQIVGNFYEAQLEQVIDLLKEINDKLAKLPVMQELYEEEQEEKAPKRPWFKPF